jgi:hypothetical protein
LEDGDEDAQNCFLNCLLPKAVTGTIDSYIAKIEMEVLHASWASEFSHRLDPTATFNVADEQPAVISN